MKKNLLLVSCLLLAFGAQAQSKNFLDQGYLETSAQADTLVIPDRIYLGILLQEGDSKGRVTLEELEQSMAARLKAIGIDLEKQLAVSDLSSDFRKYFLRGQEVLKDKAFELLVYDAAMAGRVLFELEKLGIANVRLNRTEYAALDALQMSLKAQAMRKAKLQATTMTDAIGQSLGKAVYISDSGNYYPMAGAPRMVEFAKSAADQGSYEPIEGEFQKIRVEASVQVKFLLD